MSNSLLQRKALQVLNKVWKSTLPPKQHKIQESWVKEHGYPVETHEITTEDGYKLTFHRIPHGKEKPHPNERRKPVILQHGFLQASGAWVLAPSSFGYLLADRGFDVWLANARGNVYSRKHVSLNPDKDKKEFWDFSWHEMGYYDLPAAIDYILDKTKRDQVFYIGFSMGTTMFLVLGATRPEYMPKVQAAVLLAPFARAWHVASPVVNFTKKLSFILRPNIFNGYMYECFPLSRVTPWLQNTFCGLWPVKRFTICENIVKLVAGFHKENIDRMPLALITKFYPAGTSYKTIQHFKQIMEKDFSQYDYGTEDNLKRYGSKAPPAYNLSRVTAPVYIHFSTCDWLSVPQDVKYLVTLLPNVKRVREVPDQRFNHWDFTYATQADTLVYDDIITTFSKL